MSGELRKLHGRIVELESAWNRSFGKRMHAALRREARPVVRRQRGVAAGDGSSACDRAPKSPACGPGFGRKPNRDIVSLTVAIARRVLRRELSVDPEAIHGVVKAALEKVQRKEICVVRTHPEHVPGVRMYFEKAGLSAGVEIVADASLQPGGLVVETKRGNLDASVETQLKEIERGFTDRLGR